MSTVKAIEADLTGKRALVTGASGGLGEHFAEVLARAGAEVVLAARREAALKGVCGRLKAEGLVLSAVRLDVRDRGSIDEAVKAAGPLDILVNNAGVTWTSNAIDQPEEDWDYVLDINLKGAFGMAQAVARSMIAERRPGSIINIASIFSFRQAGQVLSYAVSKAGLLQMTKSLALELARHHIRVNALAPGYIETDMNRDFWETPAGAALIKRIPQRRLGTSGDLDGPLLLLASDASRYMTGTAIVVDGGHLLSSL